MYHKLVTSLNFIRLKWNSYDVNQVHCLFLTLFSNCNFFVLPMRRKRENVRPIVFNNRLSRF